MKYTIISLVVSLSILCTSCGKEKQQNNEPTREQKEEGKKIRKGEFEKSSGKTW